MSPGYDVFISYKSWDAQAARAIADRLIASGIRVWFAEYEILLVNWDEFQSWILDGLERSSLGLVLTNDRYASSVYCRLEIRKLMDLLGPERVLEVRLPEEPETHRIFPELAGSRFTDSPDLSEILDFVAAETGWSIRNVPDEAGSTRSVEGICLGERYSIDTSGWEVVDPRGYRHPDGTVEGPVMRFGSGDHTIDVNVYAGPESAPEARDQTRTPDDRAMYDALRRYLPYHLGKLEADLRGLHLMFHGGLSQMAVTYTMRGYWTRKYSVILPHPSDASSAEFVFTFGFSGLFEEYCLHTERMEALVASLAWGAIRR